MTQPLLSSVKTFTAASNPRDYDWAEEVAASIERGQTGLLARQYEDPSLLSFGGPAGQIAVMHRILVEEKRWVSESRFLHALNYCMLLPGPEAQQLATYIGWLMHRTLGGVMAGGLFILPGAIAIMALSFIYALFGDIGFVAPETDGQASQISSAEHSGFGYGWPHNGDI